MTLAVGVIGTGAIGRDHARRIARVLTGAGVVAVTDVNRSSAEACAREVAPRVRALADGHALIADPAAQAVVVTSWGPTHEEFVLAAIAAGKPVFCQKPLATTAAGARRIVEAGAKTGRRLVQAGFMRRFGAGYRALKAVVDTWIGAPLMVHARRRNPAVGDSYTTPIAVVDTAIHEIDVLCRLRDDDHVSAQVVYPRKTSAASAHLADPQIVMLETARGVRIDVEIFVNCKCGSDIQCAVVGENGVAYLPEPMAVATRQSARTGRPVLTDWTERVIDSCDVALQAFIAAARNGTAAGPTAWDGCVAAVSADACVAAQARPGEIVPIALPARPAPDAA